MKLLFGDYETYYSRDYTLRRMTPVEYILDHRWEMIGCATRSDAEDDYAKFLEHDEFVNYLSQLDPKDTAFVSFNALFDACILAWRYDFHPALFIDAMGMARALVKHLTGSVSLDAVAQHLGVGKKLLTIHNVIGMNKQAIKDNQLWVDYATYSKMDCEMLRGVFHKLKPLFPMSEYLVMDGVIRATVYPQFRLNTNVLYAHQHEVLTNKRNLMGRAGVFERSDLMSDDNFATLLKNEGVDPPRKTSLKTGKENWAFAKTDEEFTMLLEDPNPNVQALVAARLGVKTTLEESRTERMLRIANLQWPASSAPVAYRSDPNLVGFMPGWMPMPLKYSGAHTHRLSGDWKLNVQNLTRGGNLRKALVAPQGFTVVAADESQVEARLTAWFCGQEDLRQAFEDGDDVYSQFAQEEIYHYPVNKKDTPKERFIGKQSILGAGFGAGGKKFAWMVETLSRLQLGQQIDMSEDEGKRVINSYRRRMRHISRTWPALLAILPKIANGDTGVLGPDGVVSYGQDHIRLPNGLCLYYVDLRYEKDNWSFQYGKRRKWLHGGKILENIIQALARIIIMDVAVRMKQKYKLDYALQCHDELVYVVPDGARELVQGALTEEMTRRPWWGPTIPLACETGMGHSYGDVK